MRLAFLLILWSTMLTAQVTPCLQDGQWNLCDHKGKQVSKTSYDTIVTLIHVSEDLAQKTLFHLGYRGQIRTYVQRDTLIHQNLDEQGNEFYAYMVNEYYAKYLADGKVDIFNRNGKLLISDVSQLYYGERIKGPEYKDFVICKEDQLILPDDSATLSEICYGFPMFVKKDGLMGLLDSSSAISEIKFDTIHSYHYDDETFYATAQGKHGIIHKNGLPVTELIYDTVIPVYWFDDESSIKYTTHYLGYTGKVRKVTGTQQYEIEDPENPGLYFIMEDTLINTYFEGGKANLYRRDGKVIASGVTDMVLFSPFIVNHYYEQGTTTFNPFNKPEKVNLSPDLFLKDTLAPFFLKTEGKWKGFTFTGEPLFSETYDSIDIFFGLDDQRLIRVSNNGMWGLLDIEGKEILPIKYNQLVHIPYNREEEFYFVSSANDSALLDSSFIPVQEGFFDNDLDSYFLLAATDPVMAQWLINKGADVNFMPDEWAQPPLLDAVNDSDLVMAEVLLKNGANPTLTEIEGRSPLSSAVLGNNLAMTALLIKYGADVNSFAHGKPMLFYAISSGSPKMVTLFIKNGADPAAVDRDGTNAIEYARSKGNEAILQMLESARKK